MAQSKKQSPKEKCQYAFKICALCPCSKPEIENAAALSLNRTFAMMFLLSIVGLGLALQFVEVDSLSDLVISKTAIEDLDNSSVIGALLLPYISPQFWILFCFNTVMTIAFIMPRN